MDYNLQRLIDIEDNISKDLEMINEYKHRHESNIRSKLYTKHQLNRYYRSILNNLIEYINID